VRSPLHCIVGAPGAGKTTVCAALARIASPAIVLDMDDLLDDDGCVLGVHITTRAAEEIWPAYNDLWVRLLRAVGRTGDPIILFTPALPDELDVDAAWARLDCDDDERAGRLLLRGWSTDDVRLVQPYVDRARELVPFGFDTTTASPDAVAASILEWAR